MEIKAKLEKLDTQAISDALDYFGLEGCCPGLKPRSKARRMCGQAYTVKFAPVKAGEPGPAGDYIDEVPAGAVVFIDNDGISDCTVWGGILTEMAKLRQLGGTVINGAARDIDNLENSAYPVYSKHVYMRSGKNRVKLASVNTVLDIEGIRVVPGDFVVADSSGVVVIPARRAEEVAAKAGEIQAGEKRIMADIKSGLSLKQAREKNNYNLKPKAWK